MNAQTRKRTNVTLDAALIERARELGVNLSRAAEAGVAEAVGAAERDAWLERNRAALESNAEWIERNGLPLAEFRMF